MKLSLKTNSSGQSACRERNGLYQGRPAQRTPHRTAAMGKSGFAAPSAYWLAPARPAPHP